VTFAVECTLMATWFDMAQDSVNFLANKYLTSLSDRSKMVTREVLQPQMKGSITYYVYSSLIMSSGNDSTLYECSTISRLHMVIGVVLFLYIGLIHIL